MARKIKISQLLWHALTNERFWTGEPETRGKPAGTYSCHLIEWSILEVLGVDPQSLFIRTSLSSGRGTGLPAEVQELLGRTSVFFQEMGLSLGSGTAFVEFHNFEERQGARFLWLHMAYLYAKENKL